MTACCSVYAVGEPPPVNAFTDPDANRMVTISPSGAYLASSIHIDGRTLFRVVSYPEQEVKIDYNLGEDLSVAQFNWVGDERLVVVPARRGAGLDFTSRTSELLAVNVETGKIDRLERGVLVDVLSSDPEHVLISRTEDRFAEVRRLNLTSGKSKRIARGAAPWGGFVADAQGEIVFSTGTNVDDEHEVHYREGRSKWRLVASNARGRPGWTPVSAGQRPGTFLTLDSREGATRGLGLYDADTDAHELIVRHPVVDITDLFYDFGGRSVWAVRYDHHYPVVQYLDPNHDLARLHASLTKLYPEDTVRFTSFTRDHSKAVALVTGDRRPGDFILFDIRAKKIRPLMSRRPGLSAASLAPMKPIEFEVADGMTLYGYLTSPGPAFSRDVVAGSPPKPGPMVVYVHGGPHDVRDYWGYDPHVQLLASRGYHVLQVNFRGSGGYGHEYQAAGFGEWGARMQDDLTSATRWAVQSGVAEPGRICIYGASYGAYAALMGAVREPQLYECAVGISGIYDLTIMEKAGDVRARVAGVRFLRRVLGEDEELLRDRSPVHHAADVEAAVFLVHGGRDRRAPPKHSTRMRDALEEAGKDVEFLFDPEQGHGFRGNETQHDLAERLLAFLHQHIGPDSIAAAHAEN